MLQNRLELENYKCLVDRQMQANEIGEMIQEGQDDDT